MNNEKTKNIIKVIITIAIVFMSFLLFSKKVTFDALLSSCISSLHSLEKNLQILIVFVKDIGEGLYEMTDLSNKVSSSFDNIAPLLLVILGAVYFIQILLSYAAKIVFFLLIPLVCIHYLIFLIKKNPIQKRKILKGILWITVLLLVLPISVNISEKIEQTPAYNSVEKALDDSAAYHRDSSILNIPSTKDDALSMIRQYLKIFGLLFITRILIPLIFVIVYLKIMQTILMKVPFINKQLKLPEPIETVQPAETVENADDKEAESTHNISISEEVQAELEEKRKITQQKYKRNRLIRRIVILVLLVGSIFGFKTGLFKLPDNVKKVLIGTSVPLEYAEYTMQPGDNLEILEYEGFTVSTAGLQNNEFGGCSLNITVSGNEYNAYVTNLFVNGTEVMPSDEMYISCDVPVRLYDEILRNYLNSSDISEIMFTICLSGSEEYIQGTPLKSENIKLHIAGTEYESVDTSQLADPLFKGKETVIWNLGTGAGYDITEPVNYCLLENQSDYNIYVNDNRASINGELKIGEGYSGFIRSGQKGLIRFKMENTEGNEDSPYRIDIEPEENASNSSSLFGEYYRNLLQYRDNFGKIEIIYY
ncbi:hypothetical protein JQM69_05675 [Faecalicatena contorta]|uniref:hypothetical protein n=1 Tax=Faecalicatena contorta TaxID=39482 RepID=UPI001F221AF4|nr:hypothetical protein [Faecalicatena contorta]MCF2680179.1 hypothetical protein [Faecalicatena contorta]